MKPLKWAFALFLLSTASAGCVENSSSNQNDYQADLQQLIGDVQVRKAHVRADERLRAVFALGKAGSLSQQSVMDSVRAIEAEVYTPELLAERNRLMEHLPEMAPDLFGQIQRLDASITHK
ncbi:MAG: hypothetical protein LCH53_03615 [Bacteroidetes bacterium]|nr:hypothetical protein [Bacteroidota bacterium]